MPKGVPARGFRLTKNRVAAMGGNTVSKQSNKRVEFKLISEPVKNESDTEIEARIGERFDVLEQLTKACIDGAARALIVSGPAGLGKSFTVEQALSDWDASGTQYEIIKGFARATGLFKKLFQYRNAGQVLVFDDSDSIFYDDVSLNLLKAVCDTTETRRVSWLSEGIMIDEDSAEPIPNSFEFEGTVIFITNLDFDELIERGHKLAPHLQALMSRAHYVDLTMKTKRDYLVRINQVIRGGLLDNLKPAEKDDVVKYINSNHNRLRELSLRIALKIAGIRKSNANWERVCNVTCCRNT